MAGAAANLPNVDHRTDSSPLKVVINGAGIGGLTAAIALRRQGHEVHVSRERIVVSSLVEILIRNQIYEQSRFKTELGAAIGIAPNANGVLKSLGIDAEGFGANECEQVSVIHVCSQYQLNDFWRSPNLRQMESRYEK